MMLLSSENSNIVFFNPLYSVCEISLLLYTNNTASACPHFGQSDTPVWTIMGKKNSHGQPSFPGYFPFPGNEVAPRKCWGGNRNATTLLASIRACLRSASVLRVCAWKNNTS